MRTKPGKDSRNLCGAAARPWFRIGYASGLSVRLELGAFLLAGFYAVAQAQGALLPSPSSAENRSLPGSPQSQQGQGAETPERELAGTITGVVVDSSGSSVAHAHITISRDGQAGVQTTTSDETGQFSFASVIPGAFQLIVAADGFTGQTYSGTIHAGEALSIPPITLNVASASTEVKVSMSRTEEAEAEIKDEEKQRVLGVLPNFYVTYNPSAAPLSPKQKFELAWKSTIDPVNFGITAVIAGIEQGTNDFSGYGQGAQGYGKRFGAAYADSAISTFIGSAILPSLWKQDPRYFYKGTGSVKSRIWYALEYSVMCHGDNGKRQVNYSGIVGGFAAAGISNAYYPASNRDDATLTFENAAIGIGATAASNILQEFVIKKLTPHAPNYAPVQQP
jgi:hypothetical protein